MTGNSTRNLRHFLMYTQKAISDVPAEEGPSSNLAPHLHHLQSILIKAKCVSVCECGQS